MIPAEIKSDILEKYKSDEVIAFLKMDVLDRFFEQKYPGMNDKVKKRVFEVLKDWQRGKKEEIEKRAEERERRRKEMESRKERPPY